MEHILVVDDDPLIRDLFKQQLSLAGYTTDTAIDGLDALLQIVKEVPDVLVSDLNMPRMSGFELLSVVRRRFPQIAVLAASGAFEERADSGVIADAFYAKGKGGSIVSAVNKLVLQRGDCDFKTDHLSAPVWIPRNGHDSSGIPFIVLTCTHCLRSFPINVPENNPTHETRNTPCIYCETPVIYIIDFSIGVVRPVKLY